MCSDRQRVLTRRSVDVNTLLDGVGKVVDQPAIGERVDGRHVGGHLRHAVRLPRVRRVAVEVLDARCLRSKGSHS